MRIWILGSGTPTPSLRRMCSGYLVQLGASCIVFDHGFGAHHRLLELAAMARDAGVKTLVLTHITEQLDRPGIRERAISEMAEVFKGAILFGNDLLEVPIAGAVLGKLD